MASSRNIIIMLNMQLMRRGRAEREKKREREMEEGCTLIEPIGACCKNVNQTAKQLQLEMFNNGAIKWQNGGMKNK